MDNNDSSIIPPELAAKERRIRMGIYSFMACLGMAMISLAAGGAFEMIGGPVLSAIGGYLFSLSGIFFAGIFISFGILISGAVMAPREVDVRPWMSTTLSGVTLIFSAISALFTLIVLGIFAWIMLSLYAKTGMLIMISVTFFLLSASFFALSVIFIISRNILRHNRLPGPLRKLLDELRTPGEPRSRAPEEFQNTERVKVILSRVDKFLGSAIGIVFGLLLEGADSVGLTGTVFGLEIPGNSGFQLTPERFIYMGASIFIFIFAALIIIRAIRGLMEPGKA